MPLSWPCSKTTGNHQVENYPRASFAMLDRAGHNLPIEQEALFTALVSEWVGRVEENPARAA